MPQLIDYPRYALQLLGGERSRGERSQYELMKRDVSPYVDMSSPRDILELANGRLRPQYSIMRAAGHRVTGVDFVNRPAWTSTDMAYALARQVYTWRLGLPGGAMPPDRLLVSDVGRLPFAEAQFDLAVSAAAFVHFLDVPAVVAEVHRVLRPGGLVWVSIHVFTGPTGGHNLSFTEFPLRTVPPGVDAWDHLRQRRLPFTVPLNEWRPHQYIEAFARHFDVLLHVCIGREGEHLLTPEIERELAGYTRDELTCGALAVMARKALSDTQT
jgi:SAM-dependent methyltransferase